MTCGQFDDLVADLARHPVELGGLGPRDLATREAEDHAKQCRRCAARLTDQRTLTAALQAVSQLASHVSAPPHVEEALLEAFRRSHETQSVRRRDESVANKAIGSASWHRWAGLAAAAVFALVSVGMAWTWWSSRSATAPVVGAAATTSPGGTRERGDQRSAEGKRAAAVPSVVNPDSLVVDSVALPQTGPAEAPRSLVPPRQPAGVLPADTSDPADTSHFHWVSWAASAAGLSETSVPSSEIDTAPMVRISVTRAALVALGVLDTGTGDPAAVLEADVIVGEDGLARAIRIVNAEEDATPAAGQHGRSSGVDLLEGEV